jgi:DNA invertase Pin-like site-specific DNA recombinase
MTPPDKRQEVDNQRRQLREFCEVQGWQIVGEYTDEESGAKSDRAGFQLMWHDAAQRKFDVLLFWALDRFSREGVLETLNYLQRLNSFGINWRSHTEQYLDSCGVFREAVLAILAAIAKQERIRISERTRAGLDHAREKGTRSGRPIGRPRLVFRRDQVRELRKEGLSWRQIAIRLHASPTGVRRAHTAEIGGSGACREEGKELRPLSGIGKRAWPPTSNIAVRDPARIARAPAGNPRVPNRRCSPQPRK